MIRIDRLIMAQAIAIASAMVAAVIGGLLAQSWIWAIACAIFVYAGLGVAGMFWMSRKIRTDPRWHALRDSTRDDDGHASERSVRWDWHSPSDSYFDSDQDDFGGGYGEESYRMLGSHDPGRPAIEGNRDE